MELPISERPREKLYIRGAEALSNQELLAILIGNGIKGESAMALALRILGRTEEGVRSLMSAKPEEFAEVPGVGMAKACRLSAAVELAKRMSGGDQTYRRKFDGPDDIASLFIEDMRYLKNEVFKTLLLNVHGEMTGCELVSVGSISASIVDAREVFRPAIKRGAANIVLVHNHPSGDPEPSQADIDVTKGIMKAGDTLGVKVLDHLIIGDGCFFSFRREKLM
jgi:DNA repair protein RadC